MNELALFAGAGGGILGGKLLGWRCVCAVERDPYARDVLVARQNDGCLDPFPVWDDVCTFDGRPWRGIVDVVSGGFPCQDISVAGKGAGIGGERSGLWREMARIIGEVRPRFVLVENSPMLVGRGLAVVLADLAAMGYDARWGVVGADDAGAPHRRKRIWIVAYAAGRQCDTGTEIAGTFPPLHADRGKLHHADGPSADVADADRECDAVRRDAETPAEEVARRGTDAGRGERDRRPGRKEGAGQGATLADADSSGLEEQRRSVADGEKDEAAECCSWWLSEPDVGRVAHGVAARVDRLRCIGNGQVPAAMALAWRSLTGDA